MDRTFDDYKHNAEDFLQRYYGVDTRRNFNCINPMHRDSNPSMGYDREKHRAHCFGCNESYDLFDLVGLYFKIEDKGEQFKKVQELYGGGHISSPKPTQKKKKSEPTLKDIAGIKKYVENCKTNAYKTDYFQKRGFTMETVQRCNLGFDEQKNAIVIPYSKALDYFQTRSIDKKSFYKPEKEIAGSEPLYNSQALRLKTRKPVFVVESPICAISIMQCGGQAVALGGTGAEKLYQFVKAKKPLGTLILSLDNDEVGALNAEKLRDKLSSIGVKYITYNISDECKDPNDLLMKDAKRLSANIGVAISEGKKLTANKYDSVPLEELLKMKFPPRVWLVDGLISTGLTIVASPSKAGKSWLMLQLMQCIVEGKDFLGFKTNKYDVEYMALEDDPQRIVERTLKQRKGATIQPGCYISNKAPTLDNETFIDVMAEKLEENPRIKMFIVDTLQKIRRVKRKDDNSYAFDYEELGELKEFADDNKIAIVVVHHTRKMVDEVDPFQNILGSTAVQGVVDSMIVINNRKKEQIMLFYKGRDIPDSSKVIELDDDKKGGTFTWNIVGTPEEQEKAREDRMYNSNPIVRTVKALLQANPSGWRGTSTDFLQAMYDVTKEPSTITPTHIGREINALHMKLYADGIHHDAGTNGKSRYHTFTYVPKIKKWQMGRSAYQTSFNDD